MKIPSQNTRLRKITHIAIIAAAATLSAACTKESSESSQGQSVSQITATWDDGQTKTVLSENGTSVLWSPNDEISVFYNEDGVKFTSINTKPKAKAIFTSSQAIIYGGTEDSDGSMLYAIYPYSEDNAQTGETLTLTVPYTQTGVAGSFARGSFPSVGRSENTNIPFYNVCGGIRFTVGQSDISKIEIYGGAAKRLAGKVEISFDEENHPYVSRRRSSYNILTLNAPLPTGFETGKWYYISTLPAELNTGFTVRFYTTDGKYAEKNFSSSYVIKRSVFGSITEIDKDVVFKKVITGITLSKESLSLAAMKAAKLTYTISPSDAEYEWLKWKSSNESVAIVNNGIVTAIANGECIISLTSDNGCVAKCKVKVSEGSIIIKEAYVGGFTDGGVSMTGIDDYIILYNNSAVDADASDIVIAMAAPYNANASNKYYNDGTLSYENESWIPAIGAIWWFKSPVTIPAYSQIVVACYGAIDHTQTYAASVDLSKAEYYWMSNVGVTQYTVDKYKVAETIPASHYLTCSPFTKGAAWALSVSAPALYIGQMNSAEADRLSRDSENYDHTMGTSEAFNVVKFPKDAVVDVVEIFDEAKVAVSYLRYPVAINTGYTVLTYKLGHTTYRNVDQAATEALEENAGKIVKGYDTNLDPSGIDAEASIKNGAHIIYKDTNNSGNDFHQREVASIK